MSDIKDWSTVASDNNKAPPNGWPENMAPSDVNNTARENMAAAKRAYLQSPYMSPGGTVVYVNTTTVTIADDELNTDYSQFYTPERRAKIISPTGNKYACVVSATYSAGVTTIVLRVDGGADIPTDLTDVMLGIEYNDIVNIAGPNLLGMVLPYTADVGEIPAGFLLADGGWFDEKIYGALAALYDTGTTDESGNKVYKYGGVDVNGAWHPKKPDVRGYFPRFLDNRDAGSEDKIDADSPRSVGTTQAWSFAELEGGVTELESVLVPNATGPFTALGGTVGNGAGGSGGRHKYAGFHFDLKKTYPDNVSEEVRPSNIAFPGLIVAYGGCVSASGIKVEDLLDLTIEEANEKIDAETAAMKESIGELETQVETLIASVDPLIDSKIDTAVAGKQDVGYHGSWMFQPNTWSGPDASGRYYRDVSLANYDSSEDDIFVAPAPPSFGGSDIDRYNEYLKCGIYAGQSSIYNIIRFFANSKPTTNINIVFTILKNVGRAT